MLRTFDGERSTSNYFLAFFAGVAFVDFFAVVFFAGVFFAVVLLLVAILELLKPGRSL